jgi:glycine betaine catabolism A
VERRTLPGPDYWDPAVFAADVEQVFYRSWFLAGVACAAPEPGDWFTVAVGEESVLVVRGDDGALRAFYNVCRHRGARLRDAESGHDKSVISCAYHAWCYRFDGELAATPRVGRDEIDRSQHGLRAVHLAEWEGIVWVNLDDAEPEPLLAWLERTAPDLLAFSRYEIPTLRPVDVTEFVVEANWKIVLENYLECLHCPTVHPELVEVIPAYKKGWVFEEGRTDGGVTALSRNYGPAGPSIALLPSVTEEDASSVYGSLIYPNGFLDIGGSGMILSQLLPQGPTTTRVRSIYLFHPDAIAAPDFDPTEIVQFSNLVTSQDNAVCEMAQRGLRSRSIRDGGVYPEKDEYVWEFNQRYLEHRGTV